MWSSRLKMLLPQNSGHRFDCPDDSGLSCKERETNSIDGETNYSCCLRTRWSSKNVFWFWFILDSLWVVSSSCETSLIIFSKSWLSSCHRMAVKFCHDIYRSFWNKIFPVSSVAFHYRRCTLEGRDRRVIWRLDDVLWVTLPLPLLPSIDPMTSRSVQGSCEAFCRKENPNRCSFLSLHLLSA